MREKEIERAKEKRKRKNGDDKIEGGEWAKEMDKESKESPVIKSRESRVE